MIIRLDFLKRPGWLLVLGATCVACASPPPKPTELEAFERLRADPSLAAAQKRAPDLMSRSEQLLQKSRESWQSGDLDEARTDALLGQAKLKQALALTDQDRSRLRLKQADVDLSQADDELGRVTKDLSATKEQVELLTKLQLQNAERESLTQQLSAVQQRASAEKQTLEQRGVAVDRISAAELAIKEAETLNAAKHAPVPTALALDMLKRAQKELAAGDFVAAQTSADVAKTRAKEASEIARPLYQQEAESEGNRARAEALARDAAGTSFEVRRDARGALQRLILEIPATELFVKRGTTIVGGRESKLQQVTALMQKYPSYPVQVVGYTDNRGKADGQLALSLARAQSTFSALVASGVDIKRMIVSGQGAAEPVADNKSAAGRARNNRIEIIFLYQ